MENELDRIEKTVDRILSPDRAMRWIVRIAVLGVIIATAIGVTKVAFHFTAKVDKVTTDRDWFATQYETIQASKKEEASAKEAMARHQEDVKSRSGLFSISHKSDRDETNRLNNAIMQIQTRRVELIKTYNSKAQVTLDPANLSGLPARIEIE